MPTPLAHLAHIHKAPEDRPARSLARLTAWAVLTALVVGWVALLSPLPAEAAATWTPRDSNRLWRAVTSSADGTRLVAVAYHGQIYTSTDSGATWTPRESDRDWISVASSVDGTRLAATVWGGKIYTSTDSGTTWTPRDSSRSWYSVASSADGTRLVAVAYGGQIYTSTDSGATWTSRDSFRNWCSVASSADGTRLAAVVYNGQIYTSTDSGATWSPRESDRKWLSVASSADGTRLVAAVENGQIYTSTDAGATWTTRESNRNWISVASSVDGTRLVAGVENGQIYTSTDSGANWTTRESNRNWYSVASSADGTRLVAVAPGGPIYMASLFSHTVTTTAASSVTASSTASGGNVTMAGGDDVTVRGVCYGTSANPDTSGTCTSDGAGDGAFASTLTGLTPGTTYHYRAYASNDYDTAYGTDQTFTTASLITATAGTGGSISPAGATEVASGSSQAYTISPNAGYRILDVTVDSGSVGAQSSYTFTNVTSAHTIAATFQKTWTLTASAGTGGSISSPGTSTVDEGSSVTYAVTPSTGYAIDTLSVDGQAVMAASSYTFPNVTSAHTIAATFRTDTPAAIASSASTTMANRGVSFTPTYSGTAASYAWSFGDGTTATSTTADAVQHAFTGVGSYTVTCAVKDSLGNTVSSSTITIKITAGRIEAAPVQSVTGITVTPATETLADKTAAELRSQYSITDETIQPLRAVSEFTATVSQAGAVAVLRFPIYDLPQEVAKLRLIKLKGNGTNAMYTYRSSASYDRDGSWWITDETGYDIPLTATLAAATKYYVNFAIKDNGPFDADLTAGVIEDPVSFSRSDTAVSASSNDGGDGGGGCVYLPVSQGGLELMLLLLGGAGLAALGRKRR